MQGWSWKEVGRMLSVRRPQINGAFSHSPALERVIARTLSLGREWDDARRRMARIASQKASRRVLQSHWPLYFCGSAFKKACGKLCGVTSQHKKAQKQTTKNDNLPFANPQTGYTTVALAFRFRVSPAKIFRTSSPQQETTKK